jgi:hypothetical protein
MTVAPRGGASKQPARSSTPRALERDLVTLIGKRSFAPRSTIRSHRANPKLTQEENEMRGIAVESSLSDSSSMVSSEFLDGIGVRLQPEKRLMLAVLEDAVSDFQKYATATSGRGRRLFVEADAWFRSSAADQPLTFEVICQALALDPSFIRAGLRRWYMARKSEPLSSRTMIHFPFRRASGGHHTISVAATNGNARPASRRPLAGVD